jgi:hypothetical protein
MALFHPLFTDRYKSMHWDEVSSSNISDDSDEERSPSYLKAARHVIFATSPAVSPVKTACAPRPMRKDGLRTVM